MKPRWTKKEDEILRKYYGSDLSLEGILKLLPQRTKYSISHRGKYLGLHRIISGIKRPNISKALKGKPRPKWIIDKMINASVKARLGKPGYWKGKKGATKGYSCKEETKQKISESMKNNWKDENYAKKCFKAIHASPNKPERKLTKIIEKNILPFAFVGNGSFVINGLNPDFLGPNNKLIELFGRAFHDPTKSFISLKYGNLPEGRIGAFKKMGYKCLIIWDDELKNEKSVISKIKEFLLQ